MKKINNDHLDESVVQQKILSYIRKQTGGTSKGDIVNWLSKVLEISESHAYKIAREGMDLTLGNIRKMCDGLNISADLLLASDGVIRKKIIALLDDDKNVVSSLGDMFSEQFSVETVSFVTLEDLERQTMSFDGFVLDYVLVKGKTSRSYIEKLKKEQPKVPLVVLTGQADNPIIESELADLTTKYGIKIHSKPAKAKIIYSSLFTNF
jgi:CheY-like chemotaxis protein